MPGRPLERPDPGVDPVLDAPPDLGGRAHAPGQMESPATVCGKRRRAEHLAADPRGRGRCLAGQVPGRRTGVGQGVGQVRSGRSAGPRDRPGPPARLGPGGISPQPQRDGRDAAAAAASRRGRTAPTAGRPSAGRRGEHPVGETLRRAQGRRRGDRIARRSAW